MFVVLGAAFGTQIIDSEATNEVVLCRRSCAKFTFRATQVCLDVCSQGNEAQYALAACLADDIKTAQDLKDCVQAKWGLTLPLTPGQAIASATAFIDTLPIPQFIRTGVSYVADTAAYATDKYFSVTSKASDSLSRYTGQSRTRECTEGKVPIMSAVTDLTDATWSLNPFSTPVFWDARGRAKCSKKGVTIGTQEYPGSSVVLVKRPKCSWPMPISTFIPGNIVLFMSTDCRIKGHGYITGHSKGSPIEKSCIVTATHVIDVTSILTADFNSVNGDDFLTLSTVEMLWHSVGDLSYTGDCAHIFPPKASYTSDSCVVVTFAGGMGVSLVEVSLNRQTGAAKGTVFGSHSLALYPGSSGSPCIAARGDVYVVSSLVRDGIELVHAHGVFAGPAPKGDTLGAQSTESKIFDPG